MPLPTGIAGLNAGCLADIPFRYTIGENHKGRTHVLNQGGKGFGHPPFCRNVTIKLRQPIGIREMCQDLTDTNEDSLDNLNLDNQ